MRRFRAEDLRAARSLLTALISETGERVIVPEIELRVRSTGGLVSPDTARYLLEELVASRIVRRRNHHGEAWVELAHDFLTAGISKWVTEKDIALKRARAVIERAVENFRAHSLMVDAETLELVLPFADQLSPTPAEADLLLASCLSRGHRVPEWLTPAAPDATARIAEAVRSPDPRVRICGIEAAGHVGNGNMFALMRTAALWDHDLAVRKAASITLAHRMTTDAQVFLSEPTPDGNAGPVRRAVSIAMIRDHDKRLVRLPDLSSAVAALVVLGLIWVRLRRDSADIIRKSTGGLMGAAACGLFGGSALGLTLAFARKAAPVEAIGLILVLGSLGFFIGLLGGGGVSFGMITAEHVAYRHSRWWSVVGAAAGGAFVGASSNLLGVDVVRALFGQTPAGITGGLEGAAIGAGLSLGFVVGPSLFKRHVRAARALGASLGSMLAGVLLALVGGNLFSASLEIVARMFSNSQIRMDVLATLFGQVTFGSKVQIVLGALEGLLFGAGVAFGINASGKRED
jgi:hypothetical protein